MDYLQFQAICSYLGPNKVKTQHFQLLILFAIKAELYVAKYCKIFPIMFIITELRELSNSMQR